MFIQKMKVFKSGTLLTNGELMRKTFSATSRLFSGDVKDVDSKNGLFETVEQTQKNNKAERRKYNETTGKNFETGVSITSYNTVRVVFIQKKFHKFLYKNTDNI